MCAHIQKKIYAQVQDKKNELRQNRKGPHTVKLQVEFILQAYTGNISMEDLDDRNVCVRL